MAVYNKATRTAKGRAYDASVNADEFQAQYSFMYISSHDYTAANVDDLTEIEDIVIKAGVSDIKKNSDVAVSVYAPYTNAGRKTSFELRTVGLMATHPTEGLILHSIVTASVPDTVPEDDGANLVDETFQFILEEVNADNILLKGDPSGLITVNIFNEFKRENTEVIDKKADIGALEEHEFVFLNGMTQYYQSRYSKDQFNYVHFLVSIYSPTPLTDTTQATILPVGFRPKSRIEYGFTFEKNGIFEAGTVIIDADGSVLLLHSQGGQYFHIAPIVFMAAS